MRGTGEVFVTAIVTGKRFVIGLIISVEVLLPNAMDPFQTVITVAVIAPTWKLPGAGVTW